MIGALIVVLPDQTHLLFLAAVAKIVGTLGLGEQNEISGYRPERRAVIALRNRQRDVDGCG